MKNPLYDDVYATGGLPEKAFVFVEMNQLQARFEALQVDENFTVAELGFGLGLAFLATLHAWQQYAPAGTHLQFVSFEKHPVPSDLLALAHTALPAEFMANSQHLQQHWVMSARSSPWQRLLFPSNITLHLWLGDAAAGLAHASNPLRTQSARVWFLDGHDPRKNPALWAPELLTQVGACTAAGGTASTYSAAGSVRRALQAAGFSVTRQPGFPPKRHLLTAQRAP